MAVTKCAMNGIIGYMLFVSFVTGVTAYSEVDLNVNCSFVGDICNSNKPCCDDDIYSCISYVCQELPPPAPTKRPRTPSPVCSRLGEVCRKYQLCCDEFACVDNYCKYPSLPPQPNPSSSHVPKPLRLSVTLIWSCLVYLFARGINFYHVYFWFTQNK